MTLTILTYIKRKFEWTKVEQDYFDKINRTAAGNTLLTYTYLDEAFKIHTNVSAFQLGAVISQKGKPITSYSRKMTDSQQRYTVTDRG